MDEGKRAEFLAQFQKSDGRPLLGFAVLGGVFGEGVDLTGESLIGAAIVSPGLPQVGPRQEQLRDYFERTRGSGFDYAYRFPGMNKVLQAAGRVIRTPEDRGVVLLIDDRFLAPRHPPPDAAALGAAENRGLGAGADSGAGRILEITPVRRLKSAAAAQENTLLPSGAVLPKRTQNLCGQPSCICICACYNTIRTKLCTYIIGYEKS